MKKFYYLLSPIIVIVFAFLWMINFNKYNNNFELLLVISSLLISAITLLLVFKKIR
ncbi:hypothetical protein SAMN03080614_100331 [Anaerobranca gottschalkii DSM 13577]|uniref:Uncharacterized protein n=1 Tax=Anaerobranca gottschalkii DSM 13577 TaxID=1120990 RepID=A0A1H9YJ02_9FIRM|nr:hypothetical protein SAMN03080614_100331 [Anaerobranca gottschalkii DSM 13577]